MADPFVATRIVTLTFVSGVSRLMHLIMAPLAGLVWSSHLGLSAMTTLVATGCLYQEPPDWNVSKKTTPQLMAISPPPTKFIVISSKDFDSINGQNSLHISAIEKSEDDGDGIQAITFLNYNSENKADAIYQKKVGFGPGHLEDEKPISLDWEVPRDSSAHDGASACMALTLIVTHTSNVANTIKNLPIDDDDVFSITWWLSFNNPDPTQVSCPLVN